MEGDDPKWREGLKTMFGPNMLKRTEVTKKTNLVFFIVESTKGLSQIDIRLRPLITKVRKIQKEIDDEEAQEDCEEPVANSTSHWDLAMKGSSIVSLAGQSQKSCHFVARTPRLHRWQ